MRARTVPSFSEPGWYSKLNPFTTMEKKRSRWPNMEPGVWPNIDRAIFNTGATSVPESCLPAAWPRSATSSGDRAWSTFSISSSGAASCQAKANGGFSSIFRAPGLTFALTSSNRPRSVRKSMVTRYTAPRQPRGSAVMVCPEDEQGDDGGDGDPSRDDPPPARARASYHQDGRGPGRSEVQPRQHLGDQGGQKCPVEPQQADGSGRDRQVQDVIEGRGKPLAEEGSQDELHGVGTQRQKARGADPTGRRRRRFPLRRGVCLALQR